MYSAETGLLGVLASGSELRLAARVMSFVALNGSRRTDMMEL